MATMDTIKMYGAEPANFLDVGGRVGEESGTLVNVLEEADMEALGMGSLLSVSRGSRQPAKLITLEYRAGGKEKPVVLVGKGVTFDSGGISIKPGAGMDEMKYDMCGAGSVLGTISALAEMNAPVNVVGVVPATENLPDGMEPGLDDEYERTPEAPTFPNGCHIIEVEIDPELSAVQVDASQMGQVFNNLLLNAVQAMAKQEGASRELIVRTRRGSDEELGDVAVLHVIDTGPGIEPDAQARILSIVRTWYLNDCSRSRSRNPFSPSSNTVVGASHRRAIAKAA